MAKFVTTFASGCLSATANRAFEADVGIKEISKG